MRSHGYIYQLIRAAWAVAIAVQFVACAAYIEEEEVASSDQFLDQAHCSEFAPGNTDYGDYDSDAKYLPGLECGTGSGALNGLEPVADMSVTLTANAGTCECEVSAGSWCLPTEINCSSGHIPVCGNIAGPACARCTCEPL